MINRSNMLINRSGGGIIVKKRWNNLSSYFQLLEVKTEY